MNHLPASEASHSRTLCRRGSEQVTSGHCFQVARFWVDRRPRPFHMLLHPSTPRDQKYASCYDVMQMLSVFVCDVQSFTLCRISCTYTIA